MTGPVKTALIALLSAIAAAVMIFVAALQNDNTPQPEPTPTPTVTPSPTPTPVADVQILNSLERPEWSQDSDWTSTVIRSVFTNQITGFFLRTQNPCNYTSIENLSLLLPVTVNHASASNFTPGLYYDRIVDLTSDNCSGAVYLWIDTSENLEIGGASITLEKTIASDPVHSMPLYMSFNPWTMILGYCGEWCAAENRTQQGLITLMEHRISPYSNTIVPWNGSNDIGEPYGYFQNVVPFTEHGLWVPNMEQAEMSNANASLSQVLTKWFYTMDEPNASQMGSLRTLLAQQRQFAPDIKRMVTTNITHDLDVDIYCPVMEQFGVNGYPPKSAYSESDYWIYTSCMANGCGENRGWNGGAINHIDYPSTGSPDLAIDAPGVNLYGFYLVGHSIGASALLYYNSIENWGLYRTGIDVLEDQYNFGGNGDGTLMYPDRDSRSALPSVRMKLLREASYTLEAITRAGMESDIDSMVRTTLDWDHDIRAIEALRSRAFDSL